jgi:tRNA pseudouridine38-40 synthase
MERYQVILAYDGSDFHGFQRQGRSRTVQLEVETALRKLGWKDASILAAGRTDSGVHALGQVIAFDLEWAHSTEDLKRALNANLPVNVAIQAVQGAAADFHPRFDALSRRYVYHIYCAEDRNPLRDHYAWRVWPAVELDILQQAASFLPGVHDFAAFGSPMKPGGNTVREVFAAGWQAEQGGLRFDICANAFLYRMVRRSVYLLVQVAHGRLSLQNLQAGVLEAHEMIAGLAPSAGLVLTEVCYPDKQEVNVHEAFGA